MGLDVERWRDVALAAAGDADQVSLSFFGGRVAADRKADGSFVTEADRQVEAVVRARLAAAAPDFPVYGEEEGGRLEATVPTWVVDPIDATNNFLRGIPVYGTLIALVVGEQPVVGVVSAPALGERWDAAAGMGTRRNATSVSVSDVAVVAQAQVLHGGLDWWRDSPQRWETLGRIADAAWRTRGFGDFWMHLLVAGGMAEAAIERDLKPWDIAAVQCVVEQAGGRVTSWGEGSPIATGEALTTNGHIHDELSVLLAGD